jgi:RNA polymerase sigma-70 factor (ECF subfamily)
MTRDESAAADVVQRTFVKVLLHIDQFEGRAALRTWVWRIAANEALLWRRERLRRERKQAALTVCTSWSDDVPSPLQTLERTRAIARVQRALEALFRCFLALFRSREEQAIVELALLRRPNRSIPSALRVVRDRSQATAHPPLQRYNPPHGALGDSAAPRDRPRRADSPIPGLRQRRDLLSRGHERDQEFRGRSEADGVAKPVAERNR